MSFICGQEHGSLFEKRIRHIARNHSQSFRFLLDRTCVTVKHRNISDTPYPYFPTLRSLRTDRYCNWTVTCFPVELCFIANDELEAEMLVQRYINCQCRTFFSLSLRIIPLKRTAQPSADGHVEIFQNPNFPPKISLFVDKPPFSFFLKRFLQNSFCFPVNFPISSSRTGKSHSVILKSPTQKQ